MPPLKQGGPEQFRLDELIRRDLAARKDPREVISDPHAGYYGIEVSERTLVPNDDARLGETRFEDWLNQSTKQASETDRPEGVSAATANNYENLTTRVGAGILTASTLIAQDAKVE
jgi:hypothetical protein